MQDLIFFSLLTSLKILSPNRFFYHKMVIENMFGRYLVGLFSLLLCLIICVYLLSKGSILVDISVFLYLEYIFVWILYLCIYIIHINLFSKLLYMLWFFGYLFQLILHMVQYPTRVWWIPCVCIHKGKFCVHVGKF